MSDPSVVLPSAAPAVPWRIGGVEVHGLLVGAHTRCAHYHGANDIIAIRFRCCARWYPCWRCHDACETHAVERWPAEQGDVEAVPCAGCGHRLRIDEYIAGHFSCPSCGASFNAGCASHWDRYFER